jgi:hypothetical protein
MGDQFFIKKPKKSSKLSSKYHSLFLLLLIAKTLIDISVLLSSSMLLAINKPRIEALIILFSPQNQ